jgi:hypothetical protein
MIYHKNGIVYFLCGKDVAQKWINFFDKLDENMNICSTKTGRLIHPMLEPPSVEFLKNVKTKEFRLKQKRKKYKIQRGLK